MRRKRKHPELVVPDDIGEAREVRAETHKDLTAARKRAPFVHRLADGLIDRSGNNHYVELLYRYAREVTE